MVFYLVVMVPRFPVECTPNALVAVPQKRKYLSLSFVVAPSRGFLGMRWSGICNLTDLCYIRRVTIGEHGVDFGWFEDGCRVWIVSTLHVLFPARCGKL